MSVSMISPRWPLSYAPGEDHLRIFDTGLGKTVTRIHAWHFYGNSGQSRQRCRSIRALDPFKSTMHHPISDCMWVSSQVVSNPFKSIRHFMLEAHIYQCRPYRASFAATQSDQNISRIPKPTFYPTQLFKPRCFPPGRL